MHMKQLNFNNFIMGYPYHTIVVVYVQPLTTPDIIIIFTYNKANPNKIPA